MRVFFVLSLVVLLSVPIASAEMVRSGFLVMNLGQYTPGENTAPFATRDNALINPGFETGDLAPWTTDAWAVTGLDANSGDFSAESYGNYWLYQGICPVDVTTVRAVTMYSKQPEGVAFQAVDFFYSETDYDEFLVAPGIDWTFIDMTGYLRNSGTLVAIRIWGYFGGGPDPDLTRVDDVVLDTPGGPSGIETGTWGQIKALYD